MPKPNVFIYRDFLLNPSETFVRSQGEALQRYTAIYTGLRFVEHGVNVPRDRSFVLQGETLFRRVDNALFTRTGLSSRLMAAAFRLRPRLVHAHFAFDGARIARFAHLLRLPLVVTLHDYDVTTSDKDLLRLHPSFADYIRWRPRLFRYADRFLAVSGFLRERAIARGFPAEKVQVHYIGIDSERFQAVSGVIREPIVLFVGRLIPKKGCTYLISAMARVQAVRPDVELVVIGDGPLRAELEQQAKNTLGKYRFLGTQPHDEVKAWHARAQVFCLPSVTAETGETEGLPIAILEAMSIGLPLVATRHSGIPEAVIHEETGLLADERDHEALGAQILTLLSNPDYAARLAAEARRQVRARFNLNVQNAMLEDIYDEVARPLQK